MSTEPATQKRLTVRELQTILTDCDPDAIVDLTLPGFIDVSDKQIVDDPDLVSDAYGFVPHVEAFYRTGKDMPYEHFFGDDGAPRPGVKPNAVSIAIPRDDVEKLYRDRKRAIELDDPALEPEPATADANTVIVDVRLSRELHTTIRQLLRQLNGSHQVKIEQGCTHGLLTVAGALEMLAEDLGMVGSRPGSWEGSNMAQVLASHGYDN
ncbi:hypothetical protein LN047_20975 [Achromobacter sp. JD417]|jgi:hypothetical protein|uniref:hypothetical protein n=1 Tax=Achromobacter TaxID=222 RepID=UPI0009537117|nr:MULTISPECIES: hypothetical protein [Achromobacter]SIT04582.1 hypothetical protein SAMN05428937_0391 [Achromobacter sp. MFA1 R4]